MPPLYISLLEVLLAVALLTLLTILSFELWLVRLALAIIARTPVLRRLVPVQVREERRRAPRLRMVVGTRMWWGWRRKVRSE
ncbi:hypothetical protein FN846DRAFT_978123 [Sphaerosporella brunnea]|uniref:Uncharacterized protein n=1 Tax=Sphaerosporella brunnea TaxID=1250544 RepID=A0A5J5EE18_9PEZI|nr:hypothetical protein FN846DRAFT_978123 [Sphaerosporella brunnea]